MCECVEVRTFLECSFSLCEPRIQVLLRLGSLCLIICMHLYCFFFIIIILLYIKCVCSACMWLIGGQRVIRMVSSVSSLSCLA